MSHQPNRLDGLQMDHDLDSKTCALCHRAKCKHLAAAAALNQACGSVAVAFDIPRDEIWFAFASAAASQRTVVSPGQPVEAIRLFASLVASFEASEGRVMAGELRIGFASDVLFDEHGNDEPTLPGCSVEEITKGMLS